MAKKFYGGLDLQTNSKLKFFESSGANFASLRSAAAMSADIEFVLPATDVVSGVLKSDGSGNLSIALLLDANVAAAAGIALTKLAATTVSRALASDASGFIVASATTDTELGYVSGVTSAIQTQIDGKVSDAGDTMTGNLIMDNEKEVRFEEATANGDNYVGLKAPATLAASLSYTLPNAAPASNGYVLAAQTDGTMSWVNNSSTSSFKSDWIDTDTAVFALTHSLGTRDIMVQIYDKVTNASIEIDSVVRTSTSVVTLTASEAPSATGWRVLILAL